MRKAFPLPPLPRHHLLQKSQALTQEGDSDAATEDIQPQVNPRDLHQIDKRGVHALPKPFFFCFINDIPLADVHQIIFKNTELPQCAESIKPVAQGDRYPLMLRVPRLAG